MAPVIGIIVILVCIASSSAVSVERKKGGDICLQKVSCPVERPVCSSSLSDLTVACQSCRGVLGNFFEKKRCIFHYIDSEVELFGIPPITTLEFSLSTREWRNYSTFEQDKTGKIILDPKERAGKLYLVITSHIAVILKFAGVDVFIPIIPTTTTAITLTHLPPTSPPTTITTEKSTFWIIPSTTASTTGALTTLITTITLTRLPPTSPPPTTVILPTTEKSIFSSTTGALTTRTTSRYHSSSAGTVTAKTLVNTSPAITKRTMANTTFPSSPRVVVNKGLVIGLSVTGAVVFAMMLVGGIWYGIRKMGRYIIPSKVLDDAISMSTINTNPDEDITCV